MILLRLISWPYFRQHVLRTALTTAGIVLGVAVFVGMHTANSSVLFAFSRTVDRIAGKTELQVTAGEAGFHEEVLETVQAASTVRVAVPVIEAVVDTNLNGQGNLLVLGVDMTGDRTLRDYDLDSGDDAVIDDPLVFLAQPDSIILSKEFAEKNHIAVGGRVGLGTVEGERQFTVRGVMKSSGLTSAFGGNLAVMDIYAAQYMFGRGRSFDRIDLAVKEGRTLKDAEQELSAMLGPGFQVDPPAGRGQQFEAMLAAYSMMVGISSLFALFIGMFIIYNSFAIAVTQRRSEIGILRALGATRGQIRWLFLGESAVTGLIGSLGGLVFGVLIARGIAASIGTLISDVYGVAQHADELSTSPGLLVLALAIGIGTSIVAAAIPAHNAARVDPVQALQKGTYQVLSAGESRLRAILGLALGAVSIVCLNIGGSRPVFYAGYALAIVVALLISPLLSLALAKALRPILKWARPVEGALAADSLIQSPRRTSASVAALMLSLALVVAFAGMARASYDSIIDWMETALNPELFVMPSQSIVVRTIRFPPTMGPEVAAIPGVERVQMVRDARIVFRKTPVMVVAVEIDSIAETAQRAPVAGNADDMYRRTAAGEGLMVSDNLAQLQHLTLGEMLEVPAPNGLIRLPIVGIVVDYSGSAGHDPHGPQPVRAVLARRFGERVSRLPEAGRAGARRAAADSREVRRPAAGVRAHERRAQELHSENHRSVVRAHVGADRRRSARRDSRHREHADRVDHRQTTGAGHAAGGRRIARPDPPHDLARGAEHRHARARARLRAGGDQPVLHPADRAQRHRGHAAGLRLSGRHRPRARANDPRRRVHRGDLAGGVGGARLARGGAGI